MNNESWFSYSERAQSWKIFIPIKREQLSGQRQWEMDNTRKKMQNQAQDLGKWAKNVGKWEILSGDGNLIEVGEFKNGLKMENGKRTIRWYRY